ncbi:MULTISPECIES: hypothetical protein [Ensifer]|uniref:hypothetical protein n=1 Tax=Ensifer TaxID=106591 RepID=UPI0008073D45|nr:hypothetical protein [Ensifer adhaerens]
MSTRDPRIIPLLFSTRYSVCVARRQQNHGRNFGIQMPGQQAFLLSALHKNGAPQGAAQKQ